MSTWPNNGRLIAVGTYGTLLTSKNGLKWESENIAHLVQKQPNEYVHLLSIASGNNKTVAVGYSTVPLTSENLDKRTFSGVILINEDDNGHTWEQSSPPVERERNAPTLAIDQAETACCNCAPFLLKAGK